MNIMDVGAELGQFDYLIAHGIFSWVPVAVQEKIFEIASRSLAPQGVAYVSYNCLPGWYFKRVVREMMLYHTRRFTEPAKRIEQARAFVDHLAMGAVDPSSHHARLLKEQADELRGMSDTYLFHEYLEEVNQPLYFHEFAARAAAHGLQYIWESNQGDPGNYLRNEAKETLARLSTDVIRREQNIDFLINRRFRRSLLCHDDVVLDRSLPVDRLMSRFWFVGSARPQSERVHLSPGVEETFVAPTAESITTTNPIVKATLAYLHETSPRALSFDELHDAVRARLEGARDIERVADDKLRRDIAVLLGHCVWSRLVKPQVHLMTINTVVGERPVASPVARYQAKSSDRVTNLRHEQIALDPLERRLLPLLDGQRDRATLVDILAGMAETEQIPIALDGRPVQDEEALRSILGERLDASLTRMASLALIER